MNNGNKYYTSLKRILVRVTQLKIMLRIHVKISKLSESEYVKIYIFINLMGLLSFHFMYARNFLIK